MTFKLHCSRLGAGPPVVLLHGLFGSGNNLGAVARSLQDRFSVYSVDLPNHGRSGWQDPCNLQTMAESLRNWMSHQGLQRASLLGHSLGGKVAMQLALAHPELVTALVLADIAPVAYPPRHDSVFAALDAVVAANCESRAAAQAVMAGHLSEAEVIQFLLTSLRRDPDGVYRWRFNLEGLKAGYEAIRASPVSSGPYRQPVLFIKGGDSDYVLAQHRARILALFSQASVKVMPACGHWLHAQQPRLFNGIVGRFLDDQSH